jgi:hypothetical protein
MRYILLRNELTLPRLRATKLLRDTFVERILNKHVLDEFIPEVRWIGTFFKGRELAEFPRGRNQAGENCLAYVLYQITGY